MMISMKHKLLRSTMLAAAILTCGTALPVESFAATQDIVDAAYDRTAIKQIVIEEAQSLSVPPALALALAKVHSDFQGDALSSRGDLGVMQLPPQTAARLNVSRDELWQPRLNIQVALEKLVAQFEHYGNWELALAAYHGEQLNVSGVPGGGVEGAGSQAVPAPRSENFVATVLRWRDRYDAQARVWASLDGAENAFLEARPELEIERQSHSVVKKGPKVPARRPSIVVWHAPKEQQIDDFYEFETVEDRLEKARQHIDDFGTIRVPAGKPTRGETW